MFTSFVIYLLVGAVAGFTAGLFGIGGGLIIVPALVFCFAVLQVADAVLMQLALGTSLATIVVTSLSSVRAHHRLGNVDWACWRRLSPGIVFGVVLGVNTAALLPSSVLQLGFGIFALVVAGQMALGLKPEPSRQLPGASALMAVGTVIGYFSALCGIGGGSLTVPFLSRCNMRMQAAVATAAACGLPIAVAGALSNIAVGLGEPSLPAYSTGYVYWPALLGIVLLSVPTAALGAALAQRLPPVQLKRCFAALLLIIGVMFIWGAF